MKLPTTRAAIHGIALHSVVFLTICYNLLWLLNYGARDAGDADQKLSVELRKDRVRWPVTSIEESHHRGSRGQNIAVVHMGPQKTGSTSIQSASALYADQLKEDGYEMPWPKYPRKDVMHYPNIDQNVARFATCFLPPPKREDRYACIQELLFSSAQIAERGNNLLISAEHFDGIDATGLDALSSFLSYWDSTTVIIYYRRLYDWIHSFYNQHVKFRTFDDFGLSGPRLRKWEFTFHHYLKEHWLVTVPPEYSAYVISRVREQYGHDDTKNIVVMDFHNKEVDIAEAFFCNAIPNATHTCNAIRNATARARHNQGEFLHYGDLAYAAHKTNIMNITSHEHMMKVTEKIKMHYENTLGRTRKDFKQICLPEKLSSLLWSKTVEYEKQIFGDGAQARLADLKSDFERQSASALCVVDINATMQEEEWLSFSKTLR